MEHFFTTIPGVVISLGAILAVVVTGFLYVVGVYSKQKRTQKEEEVKDEDRLINILKTTVEELEEKVNKQTKDIADLTIKVEKLEKENMTLIKVLQGRDEQTQEFYKKGFEAMKDATEILGIVKNIDVTIKEKNNSVNKLIDVVSENARVVLEAAKLPTK